MGKSGNWFSALKKVLSPKKSRSKKNLSSEERNVDLVANSSKRTTALTAPAAAPSTPLPPPPLPPAPSKKDVTLAEAENEQSKHAYSVALATAAAAEAAVAAAQAATEVVRLTSVAHYPGKSKEEIAAIRIQTTFRGYLKSAFVELQGSDGFLSNYEIAEAEMRKAELVATKVALERTLASNHQLLHFIFVLMVLWRSFYVTNFLW